MVQIQSSPGIQYQMRNSVDRLNLINNQNYVLILPSCQKWTYFHSIEAWEIFFTFYLHKGLPFHKQGFCRFRVTLKLDYDLEKQ